MRRGPGPGLSAQSVCVGRLEPRWPASACYNELAQIRKVSRHPLSLRLVLEDMLMRYARAVAGARG